MEHTPGGRQNPLCSIIIPSRDGHRNGCVPRLLESIEAQTYRNFEIHLIKGVSPQGRAINQGAAETGGEVLVIIDDDSRLADQHVIERLVTTLQADSSIGMTGASIVLPPEASPFQRRAARQFPRFNTPVVKQATDSDLACHGCCAVPRRVFEAIGGEREDIFRGLDPDLRQRLRAAGYRVVLAPNCRIHHPLPGDWRSLLRIFFRNGYGSAYSYKHRPETVYETHEALDARQFSPVTSLTYRAARFPLRLARAALTGQEMRLAAYTAYGLGYGWGWFTAREQTNGRSPSSEKAV